LSLAVAHVNDAVSVGVLGGLISNAVAVEIPAAQPWLSWQTFIPAIPARTFGPGETGRSGRAGCPGRTLWTFGPFRSLGTGRACRTIRSRHLLPSADIVAGRLVQQQSGRQTANNQIALVVL
jgi:hypothetical protein